MPENWKLGTPEADPPAVDPLDADLLELADSDDEPDDEVLLAPDGEALAVPCELVAPRAAMPLLLPVAELEQPLKAAIATAAAVRTARRYLLEVRTRQGEHAEASGRKVRSGRPDVAPKSVAADRPGLVR